MIQDAYVRYQSIQAAQDMLEAIELVADCIHIDGTHYINNETAAANLDLARMMAALKDERWQ